MASHSTSWFGAVPPDATDPRQEDERADGDTHSDGDNELLEQLDAPINQRREAKKSGERLSGAEIAEIERAHAEVIEAEASANRPQANPLARARLAAAREAELDLLKEFGFSTYSGATPSAFRIRFPHSPTPDAETVVVTSVPERTAEAAREVQPPAPVPVGRLEPPRVSEETREGEEKGNQQMNDSQTEVDRSPSWNGQDPESGPDALLARLRAGAAEFVDAEVRRAQATASEIIEAARIEARTTTDVARKLQETAAAAAAASTNDLMGVLSLIDDLAGRLGSAHNEVQSRVEVLRMASGKLQRPGNKPD